MTENPPYVIRGDDGVEYGPVELAELREWIRENRVGLGTSVRPESDENGWNPWQHYPELVALLAEARVTGVTPAIPVLAPWGRRAFAFALDFVLGIIMVMPLLIMLVILLCCSLPPAVLDQLTAYSQAIMDGTASVASEPVLPRWFLIWFQVVTFVIPLLYYAGFHAAHGRTPAKSLMNIQVVDASGRKPTFAKALLRSLVFLICVHFYGIPLLYAFFHPQRRALHDLAAGTYVVEL